MAPSKNHHWWPICISEFWKDTNGCTTRLSPSGEALCRPPKNFGVIGHGHTIKMSRKAGETTVWDYNFENEFDKADTNFPNVIKWLNSLRQEKRTNARNSIGRFLPQEVPEEMLGLLMEGLVSLCVRSPMNRNAAASIAEELRGGLGVRERNTIIAANMRYQQRNIADGLGTRGKFAVIFSPDREYIFGDGFFQNLSSSIGLPLNPEMLVPLTPSISVLFVRPHQYSAEPRLSTIVVSAQETDMMNHFVQIYAKDMIFYRQEKPVLAQEFYKGEHLCLNGPNRPIDGLIHGVLNVRT
ncbi:MAG: hypothetical protein SFW65_05540 [Alphaproteobacteria bacterium]|nr:hypothetical protein [Alphaproteobacteria bacterium]